MRGQSLVPSGPLDPNSGANRGSVSSGLRPLGSLVMSASSMYLVLLATIFIVLFVHEAGHLLVARWFGLQVIHLAIGFGPELLGFTDRYGTRWSLAALPFGAFVKIPANRPSSAASEQQDISIAELRRRAAICAAGPLANLLFACVTYGISFAFFGQAGVLPNPQFATPVVIASMVAGFSIAVALFNLTPIPPLDGGMLILVAIQALTRKPIPEYVQASLCKAGLGMMVLLSVLTFIFEMVPMARFYG